MNKEKQQKTSTELALQLYPAVQKLMAEEQNLNPRIVLEALYLLMQMAYGPAEAGRAISSAQVR